MPRVQSEPGPCLSLIVEFWEGNSEQSPEEHCTAGGRCSSAQGISSRQLSLLSSDVDGDGDLDADFFSSLRQNKHMLDS